MGVGNKLLAVLLISVLCSVVDMRSNTSFGAAAEPTVRLTTRRAILLKDLTHYVENNRQQIVYLFVFFAVTVLLFAERFYSK